MSETSARVAARLAALAQKGVDDLANALSAMSAPPAMRVVVLEEMARLALKEAARFEPERKRP